MFPPGADVDTFDARLSVATIDADGPFSTFPGVNRTLFLLDGAGVDLFGPDGGVRLARPGDHFRFLGESAVVARLVDGPVRDVNWMTRRDRASGDASLVHVDDELVLYDDNTVALVVDGELELGGDRLRRLDLACGPATLTGFGLVVLARCVRT